MFDWLARIFSKKTLEVYSKRERAIYRYWNGSKEVSADPLVLYKRFRSAWPELSAELKVATSEMLQDKETIPAHDRAIGKIRDIFSLKPFADGGLTEPESERLLWEFLDWCDELKKESSPSPTQSTPTGDSPTSSEGVPDTTNSSDSGSTSGESGTGGPGSSPSVPG